LSSTANCSAIHFDIFADVADQAERLGGRQVDDQFELDWLLDRNVARLCPAPTIPFVVLSIGVDDH
jgi:hypothetical protein